MSPRISSVSDKLKLIIKNIPGPDEIHVAVPMYITPDVSTILAKLFNRCPKKKSPQFHSGRYMPGFQEGGVVLISVSRADHQPRECHQKKKTEAIINISADHPNRDNFFRNKQYEFRSAGFTAGILTAISHRINEAFDTYAEDDRIRFIRQLL